MSDKLFKILEGTVWALKCQIKAKFKRNGLYFESFRLLRRKLGCQTKISFLFEFLFSIDVYCCYKTGLQKRITCYLFNLTSIMYICLSKFIIEKKILNNLHYWRNIYVYGGSPEQKLKSSGKFEPFALIMAVQNGI